MHYVTVLWPAVVTAGGATPWIQRCYPAVSPRLAVQGRTVLYPPAGCCTRDTPLVCIGTSLAKPSSVDS